MTTHLVRTVRCWRFGSAENGEDTAQQVRMLIGQGDPGFSDLFVHAITLREAIHRIGSALASGTAPSQADLQAIGAACARAIALADLVPDASGFRWRWPNDPPTAQTILCPIALSAAGLLREGDLSRLKKCGGEHCGWLFFDLTKNNSRRWCDMAVCGSRQKARRQRQKRSFVVTEET